MSRIGKQPIVLPSGVSVTVDKAAVTVNGPKGSLSQKAMPGIDVTQDGSILAISRRQDDRRARSLHGLMRSLLNGMVTGVSQGFARTLEINGVGYRVQQQGDSLKFNLGFSHDVDYKLPDGITASIDQNTVTISGIDKQQVGQVAAEIRDLKPPEPYKGKGIKYQGEHIIRKSGKSGKEMAA